MRLLRPASFFLSLCLHAGVIALALFWPVRSTPPVDLTAQVIDIGIYTIGKPGAAPTAQDPPKAPTAPRVPTAPQAPATPPVPTPQTPPPPDPIKPPQPQVKPDPAPVPIPQPDAPVEPPKPEPVVEPPKPDPVEEPPKPETPETPKPAEPSRPATPARPSRPQPSADDILSAALGDLTKGRTTDPDSTNPEGDGPGGSGGDGIGLVGSYMQSLVSRIKPNWEYVGRADRRNPTATVRIRIAKDGTIMEAAIETSSGDAAFDGSVVKAVLDTVRVEAPPTTDLMNVLVPFAYEAIRR